MPQGLNQYDIRKKCEKPPLCYDFADVGKFLNQKSVRTALGVTDKDRKWQECNMVCHLGGTLCAVFSRYTYARLSVE